MPYFISSPAIPQEFPESCPYCKVRRADAFVPLRYSKMALGTIPGNLQSENWRTALPGCHRCAAWFRWTRPLLFLLGGATLLMPFPVLFFPDSVAGPLWIASGASWVLLGTLRRFRTLAFRVAHISESEIVFAARDESYAQEFAHANCLPYEHRGYLVRSA